MHGSGSAWRTPEKQLLASRVKSVVQRAYAVTRAADSARLLLGRARGGPLGPPPPEEAFEPGVVDLARLRTHFRMTLRVAGRAFASEVVWDGPNQYLRNDDSWHLVLGEETDALPFGSPFWLLCALKANAQEVEPHSDEDVEGERLTRYILKIDPQSAAMASELPLAFPDVSAAPFPAEVWLDATGRFRRLASAWGRRPETAVWTVVELWDFGIPVSVPEIPTER